ncbi:MAG TPA: MATE family efflux transporter [Stellaceae bacterium]|nr:MATE family efflux transporter [Stellaceae bacterium]
MPIALPLAGANLAQMAMAVTNTVMVGHLGGAALSAAGLGGALYFTIAITCQGVLIAVAPLAARVIGAGDRAAAGEVAAAGLLLAAAAAVPIVAILSIADRLLAALGYDPSLAHEIGRYLSAIRWAAPAFLLFGVLRALLAAASRARIVMAVVILAIPANAALNWALIYGRLGMPRWGIVGSGAATAIVQWLMTAGLLAVLSAAPVGTPLRLGRRVLHRIGAILRLGLPIGGLIALESGLFVSTGVLMGLLGTDALGAHQLVINFASLTFMVPLGIGQAATVRVAYELGAGRPSAAGRAAFVALFCGAIFMAAMASLMWAAPRAIAGLYLHIGDPANQGLVAIALKLLAIAALFQIFDGAQVIAVGALRGFHDTAVPMAIAAFGYWGVGFLGGWALAFPGRWGAVGLWSGLALGLATVACCLTARLYALAREARGHGGDFGYLQPVNTEEGPS